MMKFLGLLLILCSTQLALFATPSQVMLIRHGEKPDSGNGLSDIGFRRAVALVPFFTQKDSSAPYGVPVVAYAQASSKNHESTRPIQTVAPTANALGVELIASYTFANYKPMVDEIMSSSAYDGKAVLICWSHEKLGDIAGAFGVSPKPTYPHGVYDRLWLITFDSTSGKASFEDLPQQLLYGDSSS
jgi:hypothetical protein